MIGAGPIVFGLIIPWGYVFRNYVTKAGSPWRRSASSPSIWKRGEDEVSLVRLYVMRAIALVFIIGGFSNYLPKLLDPDPVARGMTISMLGGLWVLAPLALRYPLRMVPIFLYEFVWKSIWLLAFGLPQWLAGRVDPQLSKDLFEIGAFPFVFGLIIPWGYVWRHYVRAPAERWRWAQSLSGCRQREVEPRRVKGLSLIPTGSRPAAVPHNPASPSPARFRSSRASLRSPGASSGCCGPMPPL